MCLYCQMSLDFRDHGPFSGDSRNRIKIVYPCGACADEPLTENRFHAADETCPKSAVTAPESEG